VDELIHNITYLQEKMKAEEEQIANSKAEMKSYIDNLMALDGNVEVRETFSMNPALQPVYIDIAST
jgi:hypothetical protein